MEKRLRIATGIILYTYVTMHLINVSLGLHSIALMAAGRPYLTGLWVNPVAGNLLLASLLTHMFLGLRSLYRRNTLNMSATDQLQLWAGLAVVPLLIPHIVGTAIAVQVFGIVPDFAGLTYYFWVSKPTEGLRQVVLLAVVWVHGSIGILTWLRLRSWWSRFGPWINPLAVIVPVLALTGFAEAGRQALLFPGPPAATGNPVTVEALDTIATINLWCFGIYAALVAGAFALRTIRLRAHKGEVSVTYTGEKPVYGAIGHTLLEISRTHGIPHASICNGRGRCGTCRVRVISSDYPLPGISNAEAETLAWLKAPTNVRLACAMKPGGGSLVVERLIPPDITPGELRNFARADQTSVRQNPALPDAGQVEPAQ